MEKIQPPKKAALIDFGAYAFQSEFGSVPPLFYIPGLFPVRSRFVAKRRLERPKASQAKPSPRPIARKQERARKPPRQAQAMGQAFKGKPLAIGKPGKPGPLWQSKGGPVLGGPRL